MTYGIGLFKIQKLIINYNAQKVSLAGQNGPENH
jgi:hypothetical protein